jgi:hypothetical protein
MKLDLIANTCQTVRILVGVVILPAGSYPFAMSGTTSPAWGGVLCYHSFRVQRHSRCMMHKRYEYSCSLAVLDERRNGCAPYIMYGYRA